MINYLLISLLYTFRPLLGPSCCKFPVGCTDYAIEQLKKQNTLKAFFIIGQRLLVCNPFNNNLEN